MTRQNANKIDTGALAPRPVRCSTAGYARSESCSGLGRHWLGRRQPISPLAEARDGGGQPRPGRRRGTRPGRRGEDRSRSRDAPTARRRRESRERDARTGGDVSPGVGIWISWEKETCRVSLAIYILVSRRTKRMDEIRYRVSWALGFGLT